MILVKWLMAMSRKRRGAGATRIPAALVSRWQKEMQDAISRVDPEVLAIRTSIRSRIDAEKEREGIAEALRSGMANVSPACEE